MQQFLAHIRQQHQPIILAKTLFVTHNNDWHSYLVNSYIPKLSVLSNQTPVSSIIQLLSRISLRLKLFQCFREYK